MTPCNLKIGTYMADTIRIIGTTMIYLIHPDSKQPTEMTFHIASSEGSVLLSCNTSLHLGLIHHRSRLDYLPPWASLINQQRRPPKKNKITSTSSKTPSHTKKGGSTPQLPKWQINATHADHQSTTNFTKIPRHL